jgi:hypothetical protein
MPTSHMGAAVNMCRFSQRLEYDAKWPLRVNTDLMLVSCFKLLLASSPKIEARTSSETSINFHGATSHIRELAMQ